ncbi:hypothetical protein PsorP6_012491 [Peronosclerospora sorghi]|uniref:Uncharacterized protein n=1 Tax=Peronosclerospora sorghi TaxID=230839 RepID=A0ACC0WFR3_9STRA|nr:hypothetical protein PsorP6_012491 [Peronosclerospora sorghi]
MEHGAAQATGDFHAASTPTLRDRMVQATQEQETQLDAIYAGVTRLHVAAEATNDEVVAQNAMLEDVVVHVSDTTGAVQEQTTAARKVTRAHRKLGCYYGIILLLTVALLVVIFV